MNEFSQISAVVITQSVRGRVHVLCRVTVSRRTPPALISALRWRLMGLRNCTLYVPPSAPGAANGGPNKCACGCALKSDLHAPSSCCFFLSVTLSVLHARHHPLHQWRPAPGSYAGFLSSADALVVSADSANMLSEAASTGTPLFVVGAEAAAGKSRALIQLLEVRGAARRIDKDTHDVRPRFAAHCTP